jgi:hypothetical protein
MAVVSRAEHRRSNNALLISLTIHIVIVIALAGYPISRSFQQLSSAIAVEWVKNVPDPELKRNQPKQPIEKKFDPNRDPDLKAKTKISRASPSKVAWVREKSSRLVEKSVEINDAQRKDIIPEIMTAAKIKDSFSSISGLVSTDVGPVDGDGIVGDRVRAKGNGQGGRSGASILGLHGSGDGLAGGGGEGGGGILDPFGIIETIGEVGGTQKVIYCLDISASMSMGAKLPASVRSIKESMLQLGDFDEFNIVTFHSGISSFKKESVPATIKNIEKAYRFLDSFTARKIENNLGTDILAAMKYALNMEPSVIVLVTDIQPTRGEVDEERIAEEIKKLNKNNTRIYGIGIEVWEPKPDGRLAKLLKIITEQNGGRMRLTSSG